MSQTSDLTAQLEALVGRRVLCIGDIMCDRFVDGAVARISPEAPIPVLKTAHEWSIPGGAGNVARNVAALGGHCHCLGVIGDDESGRALRTMFDELTGIDANLAIDPSRPTTVKTRYIASGQQLLRADRESDGPIDGHLSEKLLAAAKDTLPQCDIVILSDYAKGVVTANIAAKIIGLANTHGKPVLVDPGRADYASYRGATLVTPNRAEFEQAVGRAVDGDMDVVAAGRALIDRFDLAALLVTRSHEGMSYVTRDDHFVCPTQAREVFDVSGAGDTVVAVLAAAMASGIPMEDAVRLANAAAGIVVGKVGTATIGRAELETALRESDVLADETKVMSAEMAVETVRRWRRRRARIGFTNGCFDLLHPGHVALLQQARSHCDRLVVGLNSDASVARLKGEGRPVQSENARALVLASLALVDVVVIFADDTPIGLIEALRPDTLVKGADYAITNVVGADFVQSYGGDVVLADLLDGYSTTDTIARIAD